jgi:magnesium chelatase family protein
VEADLRRGIPGIDITGLAEGAVKEARERVMAAFRNSGYIFPQDRILINLAPAGVRKHGAYLDLPIALAVMAAAKLIPATENLMVLGELELSGRLRPVRGVLAATAAGLREGINEFIIPKENAPEAAILAPGRFAGVENLTEAVQALITRANTGSLPAQSLGDSVQKDKAPPGDGDFGDLRGQGRYKRALEIAAAGGHNLLVFGPPGAGKTMLARRLPSIMPPLTASEAVEVTRLYSLAEQLQDSLIEGPPFRSPHHSASLEGILGGGKNVKPGEISLAHLGVLFLDEAPEFKSNVLQSLREPLEDRVITISRAEGPVLLPADFQLLLAANSCPCGRLGIPHPAGGTIDNIPLTGDARTLNSFAAAGGCFCSSEEIYRHWRKFGGALLDRIELRIPVQSTSPAQMSQEKKEETSETISRRVRQAVEIQRERFKETKVRRNARMPPGLLDQYCRLSPEAEQTFSSAAGKLGLSGRAFHGVLRVARTIADLEGKDPILPVHILEAIQHRRLGDDPYDILTCPQT